MANYRMDSEEEALFRNSPYPLYFVQSPSTLSHANSGELSRHNNNNSNNNNNINEYSSGCHSPLPRPETGPLALSRYSSSRGSNHSFSHHEKKISLDSLQSHGMGIDEIGQEKRCGAILLVHHGKNGSSVRVNNDDDEDDDDDDDDYYYGKGNWMKFFSLGYSDSTSWIVVQVTWRLIVSMIVALVVFYIATKPPSPKVSLEIAGVREFGLREGVDGTGVNTKMLTCNSSMILQIDNKSKLFGLYINPPTMEMYFGRVPFILAQGEELYAGSYGPTYFKLNVGTKDKALYGAGRVMQDMLQSSKGLPLFIRVHLSSTFHVVWGLIRPKFHHQIECLVVLHNTYNKKRRTQKYNSTCLLIPS
ncbi:hypothetical protein R3W88_001942 [Solanum pinnatisectum]|uniref:Late embryogenesis abundant protein LEA-2 subgroup domain-containing protein n=1 Tax=Solanum pinnatisectum TaxID=50273 RepID=A0AAV9MN05_9SOLN|nr:hypothetical protein R3W88_001942 [Solanum pinnatisectum]